MKSLFFIIVAVIFFGAGSYFHGIEIDDKVEELEKRIDNILSIAQRKQQFIGKNLGRVISTGKISKNEAIDILSAVYDIAITKYSLPGPLVLSIMEHESNFNKNAHSTINKDDDFNGRGLYQVIPPTAAWAAKQLGLNKYDLYNIRDNIELGSFYLSWQLLNYGEKKGLTLWYASIQLLQDEEIRKKANLYYEKIVTTKKKYEA